MAGVPSWYVSPRGRAPPDKCLPGYGNDYKELKLCELCSTGYYSEYYSDEECQKCTNKPKNAQYSEVYHGDV
jgi:hypothetical protein